MKKLVFILGLIICVSSFGQRKNWIDSLDISEVVGSDTSFYVSVNDRDFGTAYSVEINYETLSQDDWTFAIGYSNGEVAGDSYNESSNSDIPYTLDVTSNSYTNFNDSTVATKMFRDQLPLSSRWIIFKITAGTSGTGYVIWRYFQK